MGNAERRTVYDNFELCNMNSGQRDVSHTHYVKYLEAQGFLPPQSEQAYWSHFADNSVSNPLPAQQQRGLVNIFPLSLTNVLLDKIPPSSSLGKSGVILLKKGPKGVYSVFYTFLGIGSSSPLKVELEFAENLTDNWALGYTFSNLNRADFSGSPARQEVNFHQIQ